MPLENPFVFYPREAWRFLSKYTRVWGYFAKLQLMRRAVLRDPARKEYMDLTLTPPTKEGDAELEMIRQAPKVVPRHAQPAAAAHAAGESV